MSKTKIEWCARPGTQPETWNPTTGCDKVSQGCKNCYAELMHKRLQGMGQKKYDHPFLGTVKTHEDVIALPLKWKTPRTVFVNSMSDLFHKDVPFEFIDKVFGMMGITPQHTYQLLTKRPERMVEYFAVENDFDLYDRWNDAAIDILTEFNGDWHGDFATITLPNVWLGTSVEDQKTADTRIPQLLQVPAAVRFLSCEPLLGGIEFADVTHRIDAVKQWGKKLLNGIDWVIVGGESGHHARPMHPNWVRSIHKQCQSVGVPFFFKQWGEYRPAIFAAEGVGHKKKLFLMIDGRARLTSSLITDNEILMLAIGKNKSGRFLDGAEHNEFPDVRKEATA